MLFLHEYKGPIAENTYMINGLYKGQYEIRDSRLFAAGEGNNMPSILKQTDPESILSDVRNTVCEPYEHPTYSENEIEKMNRQEEASMKDAH